MNTNSKGSSEFTAETVRMINSEITGQVSSNLNEIKFDLSSQIREAIEQAITDQVLPFIRNTPGEQEMGSKTKVDLTSSGRHRRSPN